jgi:dihydroneopterin aldolase
VTIELRAIELCGVPGVLEPARREGQRFLVDVELDYEDVAATASDRIEDAIDYREVVAAVVEVSDGRAYHLLVDFATALATELTARFRVVGVRVRVRKRDVVLPRPVDHAAVVVERVV